MICQHDSVDIGCSGDGTLNILAVFYGSKGERQECPLNEFEDSGDDSVCSSESAFDGVSAHCDDEMECTISVMPVELGGDPCVQRSKYLYAVYTCSSEYNEDLFV